MLPQIGTINTYYLNIKELSNFPREVISKIEEIVKILDNEYLGNVENFGGYVQVLKDAREWNEFVSITTLEKDNYEFVEVINDNYIYLLYVLSCDYSIAVIVPQDAVDIKLIYD